MNVAQNTNDIGLQPQNSKVDLECREIYLITSARFITVCRSLK